MRHRTHIYLLQRTIVSIIALLSLSTTSIQAREVLPHELRHITIENGLLHNDVSDILQDTQGYLWIASYDGLQRYDGQHFKVYKNTNEHQILPSNRVRKLTLAPDSMLWIGTDKGVAIYNQAVDSFRMLPRLNSSKLTGTPKKIKTILASPDNHVMVCGIENGGEIWQYSMKGEPISKHELVHYSPTMFIYHGEIYDENHIIWCTSEGAIMYNITTGNSRILTQPGKPVTNVERLDAQRWIVAYGQGFRVLYITVRQDKTLANRSYVTPVLLEGERIRYMYDDGGFIWIGTMLNGVRLIDKEALRTGRIYHRGHLLKHHRISKIYSKNPDYTWVTTFDDGVYQLSNQPVDFMVPHSKEVDEFIAEGRITQIVPWHVAYVIFRNTQGSLLIYDTNNHKVNQLPPVLKQLKRVDLFEVSQDGYIWMMEGNTLVRTLSPYGVTTRFTVPNEVHNHSFREIFQGKDNKHIWLTGPNNTARLTLDEKTKTASMELLTENPLFDLRVTSRIRSTHYDNKKHKLWIGTESQGVYIVNILPDTKLSHLPIRHLKRNPNNSRSLPSEFVSAVIGNDSIGWWLGTEQGGLCKLKLPKGYVEQLYSEKDGLCNNVIKCMEIDSKRRIWIGTNVGLSCFDTKTKRFTNYGLNDELPRLSFNYESCQLSGGNIVMRSGKDFMYFNPEAFPKEQSMPPFQFGDFTLLNKHVNVGSEVRDRVLLHERLGTQKELKLKHNENIFSIDMDILNYSLKHSSKIRYQLLPLMDEWFELPVGQEVLSFSGLTPNKYTLRVQVSDSKGHWSESKTLDIHIARAPWATWWAWLIYICIVGAIILAIFKSIFRIQKLNYKVEQEERELEQARALNEEKSRYFTNVSHELKTPLTLISAPIQILMNQFKANRSVSHKLRVVERQSQKMLQLINMAHGEQMDQANLLHRHDSLFMMNRFVLELLADFFVIAQVEGKKLVIDGPDSLIYVQADHSQLETIINNLLNNAFKHTLEGDTITFSYRQIDGNILEFAVADTGHGIPKEEQANIFERFYQVHSKETAHIGGTGIGLAFSKRLVNLHEGNIRVDSEVGESTTFTIVLPIIRHNIDHEIVETEKEALELAQKIADNNQKDIQDHEGVEVAARQDSVSRDTQASLDMDDYDISDVELDEALKDKVVYLVEDNAEMRQFVESVLKHGFKVQSFADAPSCLEAMKKSWPDLIVSDVMMPLMDGYELCNIVKNDSKTSHIPVILLTACGTLEERVKGVDQGADAYISKPFHPKFLLKRVASILETREKLHERYQSELPTSMQEESQENKYMEFLDSLYKLLDSSLSEEDIDFSKMALELGLNRTHFYQRVKEATGDTPFELLKKHRIKRAAEYLLEGETVANASYRTGFKSRTHFTKVFKETYGVTPSKYANHIKDQMSNG